MARFRAADRAPVGKSRTFHGARIRLAARCRPSGGPGQARRPVGGRQSLARPGFPSVRDPAAAGRVDRLKLPYVYGDAFGEEDTDPRRLLGVTPRMYRHLAAWARGEFVADWTGVSTHRVYSASERQDASSVCR